MLVRRALAGSPDDNCQTAGWVGTARPHGFSVLIRHDCLSEADAAMLQMRRVPGGRVIRRFPDGILGLSTPISRWVSQNAV